MWEKEQIDEMGSSVCQQNLKTKTVRNGAVAQGAICKYGWVKKNECKVSGGPGTEKHRL